MRSARAALLLTALSVATLVAALASAPAARATAPAARVVVVTPLADHAGAPTDLVRWSTLRLVELLAQAGYQVMPLERTERVMRQMGLRPDDLIGLTRPMELGGRLDAGAVLTGRITRLDLEPGGTFPPPPVGTEIEFEGPPEAFLTVALRLAEVPTRRVLFSTEVAGRGVGVFRVRIAAERALRDFLRQLQAALAL